MPFRSAASTASSLNLTSAAGITDNPATSLTVASTAVLTGTSISLADSAGDVLSIGANADLEAGAGAVTIAGTGTVNFGSLTFNTTAGAVAISEDSRSEGRRGGRERSVQLAR